MVYTFGKIWAESDLIINRCKDIIHKEFTFQILENLMLLNEISIVQVSGQKGSSLEA
jgi:hypothetical protein